MRAVYREYGRLVYAVAYKVLGDRGLAEEATQQTFLKAWRASAAASTQSRELGPVAGVDRAARGDRRVRGARRCATADPLELAPPGDPALVRAPHSAEAVYDVWEVRQAVAQLPADEQEVVRLQHFEGLTHTQIAERLGVAVGTVKSRSFRAHKRLAALLGHLRE